MSKLTKYLEEVKERLKASKASAPCSNEENLFLDNAETDVEALIKIVKHLAVQKSYLMSCKNLEDDELPYLDESYEDYIPQSDKGASDE